MIKNEDYPFDYGLNNNKIKKGNLNINVSWKNYDREMEQLCLFIALLDKEASGEINCDGEENSDVWKIHIDNGEVFIQRAELGFDDREEFNLDMVSSDDFKKNLYNITKDKKLRNELIVNAI